MEIKIRYTFRRKSDGHIWQEIVPIQCLEGKGDKPFVLKYDSGMEMSEPEWEIVGRDLWTGWLDSEGNELYCGDRFFCEMVHSVMPSRGYVNKKYPKHISGFLVIKFDNGKFQFELESISPQHQEAYSKHKPQYAYYNYLANRYSEVQEHVKKIGDIYNNPELIEK